MRSKVKPGQVWVYRMEPRSCIYLVLSINLDELDGESLVSLLDLETGTTFERYPETRFGDRDLPWERFA